MKRPYRLWNTVTKSEERWCYYSIALNAHYAALRMLHTYTKVGVTLELVNNKTGKLLAQYTRTPTGIRFDKNKEKHV